MAPFHSGTPGPAPRRGGELAAYGLDVLRKEGPRALARQGLARWLYRRYYLYELRLGAAGAYAQEPVPSFEIEELPPSRSDEHRPFWPELNPAYFERCFSLGHRCFIARTDGRPLAVSWTAEDRIWSDFLEFELPLAEDEAYFFGGYALPAARGKGIVPALRRHSMKLLAESGHTRVFDMHEPDNRASARMFEKLGFRRVAVIGHYRLGRRRWLFCRAGRGFEPPGGESTARA
jgi:ribosomal protein S18 acetylase RimI-like enzyme